MSENLKDRPSYVEDHDSPLTKALGKLRREFGLVGVVLIDFTSDRVGACSSGATEEFSRHMSTLADRVLAAIDDGKFNPDEEGVSTAHEAPRDPAHELRVRGVCRDAAESRSLSLALTERPTDDEMRALHDFFSGRSMLAALTSPSQLSPGVGRDEVERARLAVRDECGSQLCAWLGDDKTARSCWRDVGKVSCLCEAAARAALSSLSPPPEQGWKPIETAPRDGTWILIWHKNQWGNRPGISVAEPHVEYDLPKDDASERMTWKNEAGYYQIHATHWQPLPLPPGTTVAPAPDAPVPADTVVLRVPE